MAVKNREEINIGDILTYWFRVDKYRIAYTNSKDSDQPEYRRNLDRPYQLNSTLLRNLSQATPRRHMIKYSTMQKHGDKPPSQYLSLIYK